MAALYTAIEAHSGRLRAEAAVQPCAERCRYGSRNVGLVTGAWAARQAGTGNVRRGAARGRRSGGLRRPHPGGAVHRGDRREWALALCEQRHRGAPGYSAHEWMDDPDLWASRIDPRDRDRVL